MRNKKLRTLLLLILNFVILFAVYQLLLHFELLIGTILYMIAAAVLIGAYYVINRGLGAPTEDTSSLPPSWSPQKKCAYIEERKQAHEKAKKLLYWLFPLILVLGIDFFNLFLLDSIRQGLSSLG